MITMLYISTYDDMDRLVTLKMYSYSNYSSEKSTKNEQEWVTLHG